MQVDAIEATPDGVATQIQSDEAIVFLTSEDSKPQDQHIDTYPVESVISRIFPILSWARAYKVEYLGNDIIAGITISTLLIPQAMAYAVIASLPPVYGLYASVVPAIIYFLMGRSPFQNIGPYAVIALMISQYASNTNDWINEEMSSRNFTITLVPNSMINELSIPYSDEALSQYINIVMLLTFMVGLWEFVIWACCLGSVISKLLPEALLAAFISSAGIIITCSQLKYILGVKIPQHSGYLGLISTIIDLVKSIPKSQPVAVIVAITTLILLYLIRYLEVKIRTVIRSIQARKFHLLEEVSFHENMNGSTNSPPRQVPPETSNIPTSITPIADVIFTVVIAGLCCGIWNLGPKFDLHIIGSIPTGVPDLMVPWQLFLDVPSILHYELVFQMIPGVLSLSFVSFVTTYSITKAFGTTESIVFKNDVKQQGDLEESRLVNSELLALSMATLIGAFFKAYTPSGSLSRAAILSSQTEAKTPLASFVAVLIVVFVLLLISPIFETVPIASLGVIVVVALSGVFKKLRLGWDLFHRALEKARKLSPKDENSHFTSFGNGESQVIQPQTQTNGIWLQSTTETSTTETAPIVNISEKKDNYIFHLICVWDECSIWWATFLSCLLLDTGTGLICGMCITVIFKLLSNLK